VRGPAASTLLRRSMQEWLQGLSPEAQDYFFHGCLLMMRA
jgi:hypothetical protein